MGIIKLTIARHCVQQLPESGLSPLQKSLMDDPARIRIAHAPTGAGKSYAFERAMMEKGHRILFIVPTRRLCQNLATGLLDALVHVHGWSEEKARSKIALWNSDERHRLEARGETAISTRRVREINDVNDAVEGGEMVIAVPEVVSAVLLRRIPEKGLSDKGVFDMLTAFDHIVFDEFHTISPRGFGLAGVFAKLAVSYQGIRAKISFLSATPIDIMPVLRRLGIGENEIIILGEELTSEGRVVHGDVRLLFCDIHSMVALLDENLDIIRKEKEKNRQVVVIYNSLYELQRDKPELERICRKACVQPQKALIIDSIDDSRSGMDNSQYFATGRNKNPESFEILIATASVEMGVTFRSNVLFMEPGFEALNFLQRYGRAARGNHDGWVFVRYDSIFLNKNTWFRTLISWARDHQDQMMQISDLTDVLSRKAKERFDDCPENGEGNFGRMPNRAAYSAGLYWNVLMDHFSNKGHRWNHLKKCQPRPAKVIFSLLKQVRKMEEDIIMGYAAKSWCDNFQRETRKLRDIDGKIRVVEMNGNGDSFFASEIWLQRHTDILDRYPLLSAEDGNEEVIIPDKLDNHQLGKTKFVQSTCNVCFPHTQERALLNNDVFLVQSWCKEFRSTQSPETKEAWALYPDAMEAALKLVLLTGLVVSDEQDSVSAIGIL